MGQLRLLESELAAGSLVIALDRRLERASGYFLLHSKRGEQDERVTSLREWIVEEAKASLAAYPGR
jgi:DNA-binding transcriptional LysR family regulator